MSKKKIAAVISAVLTVIAVVAALVIFRDSIAALAGRVKLRFSKGESKPHFTQEEQESFADI